MSIYATTKVHPDEAAWYEARGMTPPQGEIITGRFEDASLQGVYLRNKLADRARAIEEWERNIRLQGIEVEDAGLFDEPPTDGRDVVTVADKLEAVYRRYRFQRYQVAAVMANDPDNDGRGTSQSPLLVNGTETRAGERWHQSDRSVCFPDADWSCFVVKPDGSREPFQASRNAEGRGKQSKGLSVADRRAASHRAIVAKLGLQAGGRTDEVG